MCAQDHAAKMQYGYPMGASAQVRLAVGSHQSVLAQSLVPRSMEGHMFWPHGRFLRSLYETLAQGMCASPDRSQLL